jgi:hypothetical protein
MKEDESRQRHWASSRGLSLERNQTPALIAFVRFKTAVRLRRNWAGLTDKRPTPLCYPLTMKNLFSGFLD